MKENKKVEPSDLEDAMQFRYDTYEEKQEPKEKMIPVSVIDATIKDFKTIAKYDPLEEPAQNYLLNVVIPTLEELKKLDERITKLETKIV